MTSGLVRPKKAMVIAMRQGGSAGQARIITCTICSGHQQARRALTVMTIDAKSGKPTRASAAMPAHNLVRAAIDSKCNKLCCFAARRAETSPFSMERNPTYHTDNRPFELTVTAALETSSVSLSARVHLKRFHRVFT